MYIGAFRTNSNTWGQFDHLNIYIDADAKSGVTTGGNGTTTGVNWDGNTPTLPIQADYKIAIRRNNSGESFYSSYSGSSWSTGAANAKGYSQYATSSANGALEIRVPWSDLGNPSGIYFILYASYSTGYFGSAPNGTSNSGPASGKYFGGIGVSSQGCIPTNTTNTPITDLLNNAAPASGAKYGKVTISSGSFSAGGSFTVAPGGSIAITGGTLALGANTLTMGAGSTITNSGGTFTTTGSTLSCSGDITFSGTTSPITINTFSLTTGSTVNVATSVTSSQNFNMGSGAINNFNFTSNATFTTAGISTTGSNILNLLNGGSSGSSKFITSSALSIGTGTSFSLGTSALPLQVNSDVTLTGTGNLTLGSNVGGDIYLQGNWTRGTGTFTPNGRAVTFNGSTTQTIAATTPPNTFDYLAVSNTGGSVKFSNAISLNNNLQLFTGTLDLNQQTLTLTNTSNIELGDGTVSSTTESIISTGGTGTITIPTTKTITVAKRSGVGTPTFSFGNNVLVDVIGTFNPGSGLSTFASGSTLRLSAGSVSTNSPSYSSGASLIYNGFGNASGNSPSTLSLEWPSTNSPTNVTLQSTSNSFVSLTGNRTIAGNFVIGSGCKFNANNSGATDALITMSGGSSGTPLTLQNDGTMFGEYGGKTLSLTVNSGSFVQLAGATGYVDFKNTTIDGTLTCGNIGINANSASPANGNVTVSSTGTLQTTNTFGLYDGSTSSTTIRRSSGNMNAPTINSVSTIVYNNATGGQTVSAITYGNLTLSNTSGTQTAAGVFSVSGNLTLNASSTFADGGNTITVSGNVAGTGSHSGAGKILMSGSTKTISGVTLNNLQLNNAGGFSLNGSPTISGLLTLTAGTLDVNGQTLTLAGTVSATSSITASGTGSTVVISGPSSIPSGLFTSNAVRNLTLNRSGGVSMGSDLTITGVYTASSGKFSIAGNTLTLNGTVSGMSGSNSFTGSTSSKLTVTSTTSVGTVFFDQTTSADASTTTGTNALQNLVVSGGGGSVILGNKVNLFERLSVSAGTLNTGDVLVLRSISGSSGNNTAYVDQVGGTISGQVIVERYVHNQTRGWRALTAPVTYSGISQGYVSGNWQSAFGYSGNYGTRITGPSATNGLDDVTPSASLMTYNSGTGAWNKISNTTTETMAGSNGNADNKGFFLFVRGDRTVTPNGYNPNAFVSTTLAAQGKLQIGTQTFSYGGAANKAWLVGNPYACPVDMSAVTFNGSIPNFVYVWDPNRPSSYSGVTGAYVTFDRTSWGSPSAGTTTKYFQSGECFFVVPTSASGVSIVFNESNKNTGNQNNQTAGTGNGLQDEFNIKLSYIKTDGSRAEIDGVRAKFGSNYSSAVDADDAYKWSSADIENMSLSRNNSNLVIEARPHITTADTLFLNITNLAVGSNYEFKVNPVNFDASVSSCKLVDNFLNTETSISLNSTTLIGFNVSSVAGSNAAGRFYVVFNATGNLPTSNSLTVKAYKQTNSIKIDWEAIAENNIKTYTVEKSTDAVSFSKLSEATAKNGNTTNSYSIVDNNPVIGVNYYRIQSTQNNNNKVYSKIVRVEMKDNGVKSITVYPNPVKSSSNAIGLQLNNLTSGTYTARLYNAAGQQVWTNTINHNGSNGSTSLQLNRTLASGSYQLQLTDSQGNSLQQTVMVVE
jgi:hypothetical protein